MYKKISNYGIIGNLCTVALIGLDGSIDWLCLPYINSPSIFGALLDDQKGGRLSLSPLGDWDSVAEYIPETNILITRFRARTGIIHITDFMPIASHGDQRPEKEPELYRLVEVDTGKVDVSMVFEPRFDYARAKTSLEKASRAIIAKGNGENLVLSFDKDLGHLTFSEDRIEAKWSLSEGHRLWFHLQYGTTEPTEVDSKRAQIALQETETFWRSWLRKSETGRTVDLGSYQKMVDRSALVLKLLYYDPSGTIAAAATTSLPEEIGGVRNWDYRYTWVRDTSFTLQALFNLGHLSEMHGYLRWIKRLVSGCGAAKLQIMYGLRGETDLPEEELTHLDGYKGSRPIRIGNGAAKQQQLDIYGEILDAALKLSDYVGKIDPQMWASLADICDYVVEHWHDKDHGIWEVRCGPYDFVYSKVMCWAALDRGLTIAKRYGFPGNLKEWEVTRSKIKEEVLKKGWKEKRRAFVQHYETEALDASNLLIPILGFLPFNDPRVTSTIEAIQRELAHNGFLHRYITEDGLSGKEGAFLLCTFWLIDCLIGLKRFDEAEMLLHQMETVANPLGLFSEQYDISWKEAVGNFPQAFTHIGYINSVIALRQAKADLAYKLETEKTYHPKFFFSKIFLNDGEPGYDISQKEIATRLKITMNILRGAFFDTRRGRVAYERMRQSEVYKEYLELSSSLKKMELNILKKREERIAFWINLYNVIVIHGVIELGIKDSVKEVWNFFRRVQYKICDLFFSPDDIEHGILRGNRRPPHSPFKLFRGNDKRLEYIVEPIDPRIHFALVCASSSCPPIEVYTAENLDKELTIAGETFINSGGAVIDKAKNLVSLSRVFNWYAKDFGNSRAERLKFIAQYLYEREDRTFLEEKAETLGVEYQDYDWRLNRY